MRDISEQELAVSPPSLEANVIRSLFPHFWWFEMISIGLSYQISVVEDLGETF